MKGAELWMRSNTHFARGIWVMLVCLLVLVIGVQAQADTVTTTTVVSFKEGDLNLITNAEGSGLNFDFGHHFLPTTEVSYSAENKEIHLLQVEDGRINSGNWHMTVALTSFTQADGSLMVPAFDAVINLKNPQVYNENAAAGTAGLTSVVDISVASNGGAQLVMEADATLPRGVYSMAWTDKDVTLNISDSQVFLLDLEAYSALVSWALVLGPR